MRTKTDKDHKKAASQRLQFNVSLPTVLLDASDCAKLLDGTGKTSVIVVEKGGKIVSASSLSQTSSSSSSSPTTSQATSSKSSLSSSTSSTSVSARFSSSSLAPKSKLCKDTTGSGSACESESSGLAEGKPNKFVTADGGNLPSNFVKESSSDKGKVILKPPKKRRGNDKGAYEDLASSPVLNGESGHLLVSPLRDISQTDAPILTKSAGSSSSLSSTSSDTLQKHTIENLLQTQTSNNNNNNSSSNNNLISGRISHRPYELLSHQPPHSAMAGTSVQTSVSAFTSLQNPMPSLSPPSSLSTPQPAAISHPPSCIPFLGSGHQGLSSNMGPSSLYSTSSQPLPSQPVETHSHLLNHFVGSSESLEPSVCPAMLPPSSPSNSIHQPSFQRPPEQDEPMNLSTSSKAASCSPPPQSCDVPTDNDRNSQTFLNDTLRSCNRVQPSDVNSPDQERVGRWKKKPQNACNESNSVSLLSHDSPVQDVSVTNSSADHGEIQEAATESGTTSSSPRDRLEALPSTISPYHSQTTTLPQSPVKLISKTLESKSQTNEDSDSNHVVATTACSSTDDFEGDGNAISSLPAQLPSSQLSISCPVITSSTDADSGIEENRILTVCDKEMIARDTESSPKTVDKEIPLKVKKLPKKRAEVPMDEKSCASRLARYTGSIDCVITDFVFKPEPSEDISLTEEEEAIIREQFEDDKADDNKREDIKHQNGCVSKMVDTSDLEKENSMDVSPLLIHKDVVKDVGVNSKDHVLKPPKKRANAIRNSQPKKSSEAVLSAIANVESVLAFVAADITNYNPPSEEGMFELDEKYGHLLKKKKKKVDAPPNENDSTNGIELAEDKGTSPEKKVKTAKRSKVEASLSVTVATVDKVHVDQVSVSTSTEEIENGDNEEWPSIPQHAKGKPKLAKKRKSDSNSSDQGTAASKSERAIISSCYENNSKRKKKKVEGKTKPTKKKKVEKAEIAPCESISCVMEPPISQTLEDRDLLAGSKMETSDLGESLASTSGGSEQVTPVHEPETKDESTSTDPGMDKENNDTGVESGSDDKEKPVRHYKRRLDFVKCSQCDHQARGRSALSRHMKKVHLINVDMPYKCTLCTYGCTKMASLNRHLFTHGIFPCSRCDFKTDKRDKLTDHIAEQHKDKLDMKLCKICNRYIKCESVTIEEHSESCRGPTPFKCTECNKEFKYGSSLRVHYHTHFPDEPKRFKCELCDYKTNYKANLHKHHKNMHASKDKDIQCPDCGKMFSTEDNMRRHRKVHTLARPFACETCKKTFKTSGALKGHQLIHTATRPFTCNIPGCNRSFRTPKFLKSHQEEFHRLVPKKFFCQVEGCHYSFFKRSHLKRHAITHTGERNFHCTWPSCSKSFRHADNLKVHFRSHTNEKPVQCHLCDFKCKQKNSLFWHKKKVHQIVDASTVLSKRNESAEAKGKGDEKEGMISLDEGSEATPETSVTPDPESSDMISPDPKTNGKVGGKDDENMISGDEARGDGHETVQDDGGKVKGAKSQEAAVGKEKEPTDLYEFKSDDESEDEGLSPLRRENVKAAVLTPLPPPPKELLLKNEKQEQKEREKHEKAERKEQEKKERADKKEQERKEKAEKKEREKKEKAEKKEIEKKEKEEKREQEKKDKEEQKVQEKKERIARKEKEKKERERRKLEVKRLKMEARKILQKGSALRKRKTGAAKLKRELTQASTSKAAANAKEKKSKVVGTRRKSPIRGESAPKPEPVTKKPGRGRKKKSLEVAVEEAESKSKRDGEKSKGVGIQRKRPPSRKGSPKGEKQTPSSRPSSPRASSRKSPALQKMSPVRGGRGKATTPPKRKPSARIKANKKAKAKKAKFTAKKPSKTVTKKKPGRKKGSSKSKQSARKEEVEEDEDEHEEEEEEREETRETQTERKSNEDNETLKAPEKVKEDSHALKETEEQLPSRPVSPAYSEEIMVQGKASPYRDFSDAEDLEEKDSKEDQKTKSPIQSPGEEEPMPNSPHTAQEEPVTEEGDASCENKDIDNEEERPESDQQEESSDDEVSNDIPLTPPRAPAPPPMESSEDEMEPEPEKTESSQPFSVPAPNTPFSVPGPNTPFSVPPPTNVMQQHSVHSEEMPSVASMEIPSVEMQQAQGSVELHPHGSVELHPHGSVELHPHGSVELHPHGSAELHPHGSVELHPHGSVELHPHGSVELHPHGSAELHPHGSVELHPHGSVELHPHSSVEMHPNSSGEVNHSHGSVEMQLSHSSISEPMSQPESQVPQSNMSGEVTATPRDGGSSAMNSHDKYGLPPMLADEGQTTEADRKCFDQYLKNLNTAHNMECSPPSGLQQLEAMVDKSHPDARDLLTKSPQINHHHPPLPTSVITSLESSLPHMPQAELRARIDPLVDRHHESLYSRDTISALPRLSDRQSATPLLSNHATPAPAFDTFSPLNPLHPSSASSRDNSYLRQQESLFATPPVTSSFMAEAMFQRQAMTTPFLPPAPQPTDRSSLSRISDPTSTLRTNNTPSLLRRPTTMPGTEMFTSPAVPQTMPRHPFPNVWPGQEVRPSHWQNPYLPRQTNMGHANSPFFPPKENYLTGREFMFDPSSVRSSTERGMFSSLSSSQAQDSFQMDRFDISNYFPNPMAPYGASTGTLDYTRSTHSAAPKPFDERYRQTAAVASAAAIPEFRGLPPTTAAPEMFPSIGVNSGFNLYPSNPMSYHPQHMTDNMNSAFLTHSSSAQHAMLERDYAAAAAHRGLYPHHQNTPYPFMDERQYSGSSKLAPTHPTSASATQERDLMSRTAAPESQMQDPYRSMLYRY